MKLLFRLVKKHRIVFVLLFILFLGLLLRSWDYLRGDFNYFLDQSRDLLLVKQIVEDKHITLIGARAGLQGIFHGPLWLYLLVPTFIISKGDPYWTLVPIFTIFNTLLILGSFFVGKKLYGNKIGLVFAFFIAISSPIIQSSFTITNAHMVMLLFLFYLYYAIRYIRGYKRAIIWLIFFIGLAFQFESAFAVFLIPLTILVIIQSGKLPKVKFLGLGFVLFLITTANFVFFELRHQFLMSHSALRLLSGKIGVMRGYEMYGNIFFRIKDRLVEFINFFALPLYNTNLIFKLITYLLIIFGLILLKNKKEGKQKREIIFLFLIPIIYFTLYVFYPYPLWSQYLFGMMVLSCLFLSLIVNILIENESSILLVKAYLLLLVIFPLVSVLNQYFPLNKSYKHLSSYKSQKQVAEWIVKDNKTQTIGYFVYDPGLLTYNMDYLLPYVAKKNGKVASNDKKDIIYLILYSPPKWNIGAGDYWIEHTVRTKGKVLETKKFKDTDIIVKKVQTDKNEPTPDPNYFQNLIFR
ncbi:MAG: glycosyltransferase family 39 protein [Actinobacteria bacterium]|nr:glycosyltransferase family 39 protein [Actinomycetota bacterium]